MKKYIIFIICLFFFSVSFAQKEATYWYFGDNAGLDFSSGNPVADLNGAIMTREGCATISDRNGKLLFYTDGSSVWDNTHNIMPTGAGLFGHASSTQSAIIVPKPGSRNIYYIFTVDWVGGGSGMHYYTVDMSLNGGLGDVIGTDNIPEANNLLTGFTSEKVSAVKVFNENAFWVISLRLGKFYAYKVNNLGVSSNPVISDGGFINSPDLRGYLKASPDGSKIVSANMVSGLFMYDFDSATGLLSYERRLDVLGAFAYGVEFSRLSNKLYISTGNLGSGPAEEILFQFSLDVEDPNSQNINATRVQLHSYTNQRAALQIGVDGRIYRAINGSGFLGVINRPEADGLTADYQHNAISLGDKISRQGLPPFIQSFFVAEINTENLCLGNMTQFSVNSTVPIVSIVWDFGDGSPTSSDLNPTHTYSSAGTYEVIVEVTSADETKIIKQDITIFDLSNIQTPVVLQQCDDNTDGISNFNLTESESIITGDNLDLIVTYHPTKLDAEINGNLIENITSFSNALASQIFVRVENQNSCFTVVELNLEVSITTIPTDFMLSFSECDTDQIDNDDTNGVSTFDFSSATTTILDLFPSNQNVIISYYETIENALQEANEIDATKYRNENSPFDQQLVVRVDSETNNECLGLGFHIALKVDSLPAFEIPERLPLCTNITDPTATIMIENPEDTYIYEWRNQNGDLLNTDVTINFLEVSEVGDYFVTATSTDNCSRTSKVTIIRSEIATIQIIDIEDDSQDNMISIQVNGMGDYEYALDDSDGPYKDQHVFNNVPGGIHEVFVRDKNGCGIVSEQISVIGYPRFFTPNGDGINDTWSVLGASLQPGSLIYIFDRYGKILAKLDPSSNGWDGKYRNKLMPDSDYWFLVKLDDGRTRRGHFSLIRR